MGATGHVGRSIVENLLSTSQKTMAVLRDPGKQSTFSAEKNLSFVIADVFDVAALTSAFAGGDAVFLLTPESSTTENMLSDVKKLVSNYRQAIAESKVKRLVGLSSVGSQHESGAGNLSMGYHLEHGFDDLSVSRIFVRPAYYFSNWANYIPLVKDQGVLPTFFPPDLKVPMCSPAEVGKFIAGLLTDEAAESGTYELIGPEYSTSDIAEVLSEAFGRSVTVQEIPKAAWWETIKGFGASDDVTKNFIAMTEAVIDGRAIPDRKGHLIELQTSFPQYLDQFQLL